MEAIGQSIFDTVDEKGAAYSVSYVTTDVVAGVLLDKGLGKLGALGKADDVAGDVAKYTDEVAEAANKAGKHADDVAEATKAAAGKAVSESGSISVQHAVGNANQAQSVLDGIAPKYFNTDSRFGGGFYVGVDADTIVGELAEHGNTAKYAISYDMNLSGQKVLDLTNPQIASQWGYVQNLSSTKACQNIGKIARTKGYNVIKFQSYRGDGINYVIFNNFENILSPRDVTPVG